VLTWSIREGSWDGVKLAGLNVVAVVKARGTLGDVQRDPGQAVPSSSWMPRPTRASARPW